MIRSLPLLFLAGIAAEIASIIWMGNAVGVLLTLLLLFAGGVAGISLMRSAGTNFAAALRSPVQAASLQKGMAGDALARALSGVLFIIPGFFSDLAALLLFLPPIRRWLQAKVAVTGVAAGGPRPDPRFGTVIDVEAVEISGELDPAGRDGRQG